MSDITLDETSPYICSLPYRLPSPETVGKIKSTRRKRRSDSENGIEPERINHRCRFLQFYGIPPPIHKIAQFDFHLPLRKLGRFAPCSPASSSDAHSDIDSSGAASTICSTSELSSFCSNSECFSPRAICQSEDDNDDNSADQGHMTEKTAQSLLKSEASRCPWYLYFTPAIREKGLNFPYLANVGKRKQKSSQTQSDNEEDEDGTVIDHKRNNRIKQIGKMETPIHVHSPSTLPVPKQKLMTSGETSGYATSCNGTSKRPTKRIRLAYSLESDESDETCSKKFLIDGLESKE